VNKEGSLKDKSMSYPKIVKIRQILDNTQVEDISSAIKSEMNRLEVSSKIKSGSRVAISAGSRGITDIATIISSIVREVKAFGGDPFIIPAMGSHGGGTATGQKDILEDYGITEKRVGAPVIPSMEVVKLGETQSGIPVFVDQKAYEADHIIVVNRIKEHTEFQGQIESGIIKMMVIGLGKHKGATIAHQFAVKYGYERTIIEIGKYMLEKAPVSLGIGIVENGYGQTAQITAINPSDFLRVETKLLQNARTRTPKIPFDEMDILIVDECGKEISGTGMDTKVIGRIMNIYELEVDKPKITRIILRDLSKKTHGNATGVGLADFVTKRVVNKFDCKSTYVNCITGVTPEKGRLPMVCENDKEALDFAIATAGPLNLDKLRIVWIKNTSNLSELFISQGLLAKAQGKEKLEIVGNMLEIKFDEHSNLIEFWGN